MMEPELRSIVEKEIVRWQKRLGLLEWKITTIPLSAREGRHSIFEIDLLNKKAELSIVEKWKSIDQIRRVIAFRMTSIICQRDIIESERVYLRGLTLADAKEEWELQSNPEVTIFDGHAPLTNRDELIQKLSLMAADPCTFGIVRKEDNKLIGHTGIRPPYNLNSYAMEIGYAISPNYWGQGYATEVGKALVTFCFEKLNMEYVVAAHFENNEASRRVLEKIGMTFKGIEPKAFQHEVLGLIDLHNYSISKKQWSEMRD